VFWVHLCLPVCVIKTFIWFIETDLSNRFKEHMLLKCSNLVCKSEAVTALCIVELFYKHIVQILQKSFLENLHVYNFKAEDNRLPLLILFSAWSCRGLRFCFVLWLEWSWFVDLCLWRHSLEKAKERILREKKRRSMTKCLRRRHSDDWLLWN